MARAHRIGQTRAVSVYRLLTAKTYEMHMFHSASMKLGKSFTFNPSFNYTENWYPKKNEYEYAGGDSVFVNKNGVNEGFNRASWYSAAASINTSYYMTYSFKGNNEPKSARKWKRQDC